ncbi:uncharacterized protein LOC123330937 [Bubalus bubalis]|uniref:uncharacterized protein LOC123330937 n=1 Tax=Bubalus bubalis TaxID=89462 RepID=UPI001D1241EB|nr:uncharacterized protein LOC123330937 [Bubalus bubalis]
MNTNRPVWEGRSSALWIRPQGEMPKQRAGSEFTPLQPVFLSESRGLQTWAKPLNSKQAGGGGLEAWRGLRLCKVAGLLPAMRRLRVVSFLDTISLLQALGTQAWKPYSLEQTKRKHRMAFTQPGIIFYKEATGNLGVAEGTLEELDDSLHVLTPSVDDSACVHVGRGKLLSIPQELLSLGMHRVIRQQAGHLPNPGIKPTSPALASGFFTTEPPGKYKCIKG